MACAGEYSCRAEGSILDVNACKFGRIGPAAVEARLRQSADDLGKPGNDDFCGGGFVNAWRAIQ